MEGWLFFVTILLAAGGVVGWRWLVGRRQPGYLAFCEYWVYVPEPALPNQEAIMTRMISDNPHNRRGRPSIGAREGMLFSDIRLHLAVVRRDKNPKAFRPDLFDDDVEVDAARLEALAAARALVRVRYVSEVPLKDTRHLQFMPHLADTIADLGKGLAIFDLAMQRLWTAEEFKSMFEKSNNMERPEVHSRLIWHQDAEGNAWAETRGLRKVGLPELKTDFVPTDQQTLITSLVQTAAYRLMKDPKHLERLEIEEFGVQFRLGFRPEGALTRVSITREVPA